jgi:hypothetical protein
MSSIFSTATRKSHRKCEAKQELPDNAALANKLAKIILALPKINGQDGIYRMLQGK